MIDSIIKCFSKHSCVLICLLTLSFSVSAQHRLLLKVVESVAEGDFEKAQKNLSKLQEDYRNTNYESAALYFLLGAAQYSGFNPDSAYTHLKKIEAQIPAMSGADIETFCIRLGFSLGKFFSMESALAEASWSKVLAGNKWQDANAFFALYENKLHHTQPRLRWRDEAELKFYILNGDVNAIKAYCTEDRVESFKTKAYSAVDSIEFNLALSVNTEKGWSNYISTHSTSKFVNSARDKYELLVFSNAKSFHNPDSLNRYLNAFPKGRFVVEAQTAKEQFLFEKIRGNVDMAELKAFKAEYPKSQFTREIDQLIEKQLWENATTVGSLKSYAVYVEGGTQLNHLNESEAKMLELWSSKWEPADVELLQAIGKRLSNELLKVKVRATLDSLELENICFDRNIERLDRFIKSSRDSVLVNKAVSRRSHIMIEAYRFNKDYSLGISFIAQYPDHPDNSEVREELAKQFLSKVPQGKRPDMAEFMHYFGNTQAAQHMLPSLETDYFRQCSKENSASAYKRYLNTYPNGAFVKRARTSMLFAWNDSYLDNRKKLFDPADFNFTINFFLTSGVINRYFKNNITALHDILAEYYVMEQDSEENKYYFYSGNPQERYEFFSENWALLKEMNLTYELKNNTLYIDGIAFYDKKVSSFCWRCADRTSPDGGSVVILDSDNKQVTDASYHSVEATPVPHIFMVEDTRRMFSLYNTRDRKFITDWHREINPVLLDAYTFPPNSLENSLLEIVAVPIGFLTTDDSKGCFGCTQRLIDFTGKLLVDPNVVGEPCLFDYGINSRSRITVYNAKTFQPLRNFGTPNKRSSDGYVVFKKRKIADNGYSGEYYGVSNATLDTIFLDANYTSIEGINDFGLVRVQHEVSSRSCRAGKESASDLIELRLKKNITGNSGGTSLREIFIPFSSSGEMFDYDLQYSDGYIEDITPDNNYTIEQREEFEGFDEDIEARVIPDSALESLESYLYTFPCPVFYEKHLYYSDCNYKSHSEYELLDGLGRSIYKTPKDIYPHTSAGSRVLFEVRDSGCVLFEADGKLLFDGAKDNLYMQFINNEYLLYWRKDGSAKAAGIYSVSKGKVCEPIYENISIDTEGVFGYRLGTKTKLNVPIRRK